MENKTKISDNGEASAPPNINPGAETLENEVLSSRFGENPQPPEFDPYDVENLRLDPSYLNQPAAKKLLTVIPVKRPHRQNFIRVHPSEEYRLLAAVLELHEDRETFLVLPQFTPSLGEGEYYVATLFLYVSRQGVPGIWPAKMPDPDGRQNAWHTSALDAAQRAMKSWLRLVPNMTLGAYEVVQATDKLGEPQWPEQPLGELLKIAFKDRIIDRPDHLIIQKLRGLA
jgi:hypothetical protein